MRAVGMWLTRLWSSPEEEQHWEGDTPSGSCLLPLLLGPGPQVVQLSGLGSRIWGPGWTWQ